MTTTSRTCQQSTGCVRDPYDRRCFLDLDTDSRHLLILISPRDLGLKNTRTHGKASVEQSQSQTHPNQNRDPSGRAPTWGEDCGQNHACSKTKDSQPKPKPTRVFYPGGQGNLPTKGHGFKPKRAERSLTLAGGGEHVTIHNSWVADGCCKLYSTPWPGTRTFKSNLPVPPQAVSRTFCCGKIGSSSDIRVRITCHMSVTTCTDSTQDLLP